jgi:hypothetical protein
MQEIWKKSLRKVKGALAMALLCQRKLKLNHCCLQHRQLQWLFQEKLSDFYPSPPEDEDGDKYPDMGNIEEEMHY